MSKEKPQIQYSVFDKRAQPKTKKRKTPDKLKQKMYRKRDSDQRDGKICNPLLASPNRPTTSLAVHAPTMCYDNDPQFLVRVTAG